MIGSTNVQNSAGYTASFVYLDWETSYIYVPPSPSGGNPTLMTIA